MAHFGEEPPITGKTGSGTVFLSGCTMACVFCQNYQISRLSVGQPITDEALADVYLDLQKQGCENINWVTPTPHLPFLVNALAIAMARGFSLPVVFNTNGYCRRETLELLDGVVDIYLPDMKYGEDVWGEIYSAAADYFERNVEAVEEMVRQTGPLELDERGVAVRGVLVRHLVLPGGAAGSRKVFRALAGIDPRVPVSLMAQYRPCFEAQGDAMIGRRLTREEFEQAIADFDESGLERCYIQDYEDLGREDLFFPDFEDGSGRVFRGNPGGG